ncbi:MAG: hypothetical protein H6667_04520 [Ardenticatenaceae bacterium]|nr:hypothetical protein [Ardenticatenaceae bacterium]MCB9446451.1 hypothetical protein [Ardenticatenaceae bacterium]
MTNTQNKRSFGSRIWWIFRTVFISLLLIVILGGIGWAVYYGTTELQRNFNSLSDRIDANKQRVELLNGEVMALKTEDAAGQIAALQARITDLENQLAALEETGMAELTRQSDLLNTLETGLAAAATSEETAVLNDAVAALQNDINDSNGRIDNLGGELDDVRAAADQANAAADAAISDTELAHMRQTVALFQLWEHIARARLHLAEDNVGLATDEAGNTLRLMDLILAAAAEEDVPALELIQTRLSLAVNDLPDDPATAVLDLENAWGQLDAFLTTRLYPDVDVEAVLGATAVDETQATATEETTTATPEATTTPTATATPSS